MLILTPSKMIGTPTVCGVVTSLFVFRVVDADEIRRLSRSFRRLDLNQNGALDVDEFLQIPELQQNPLVRRVIEIFDEDGNGEVDFKGKKCRWRVRPLCLWECACLLQCGFNVKRVGRSCI